MAKKIETLVRTWLRAGADLEAASVAHLAAVAAADAAAEAESAASLEAGRAPDNAAAAKRAMDARAALDAAGEVLDNCAPALNAALDALAESAAQVRAALPTDHMVVRFEADHEVQDEHRKTSNATIYSAGEVHAFPEASALHFIRRGKAVAVEV